ncbi:hypothetical protein GJ496_007306 [Pomphorhynchus laevis]|nr:hypothetical protein GJ496_007306 [Pomphorhynchus laevis]
MQYLDITRSTDRGLRKQSYSSKQYLPNDERILLKGNIFAKRYDFRAFLNKLPIEKQNAAFTKFEDDGPFGNDESRINLLSQLSFNNKVDVCCLICLKVYPIYEQYPLVDGTLFLSSTLHRTDKIVPIPIRPNKSGLPKTQHKYLYLICINCLHSNENKIIRCRHCKRPWQVGRNLIVGALYARDVLTIDPCCEMFSKCNYCQHTLLNNLSLTQNEQHELKNKLRRCERTGNLTTNRKLTCPKCRSANSRQKAKSFDELFTTF